MDHMGCRLAGPLTKENSLYGFVKLTYSLYGPGKFKIPCMAHVFNFIALYDTIINFGP